MKELVEIPWDAKAFEMDAYEIGDPREEVLRRLSTRPGHYTVRVAPLSPKRSLHENGFYYCDTLVETYCARRRFIMHRDDRVSVDAGVDIEPVARVTDGGDQQLCPGCKMQIDRLA